jgi:hypothetical protein
MSAGDGGTIELRIRISRRGGGSARCSGSRALAMRVVSERKGDPWLGTRRNSFPSPNGFWYRIATCSANSAAGCYRKFELNCVPFKRPNFG